ncbi:MULTISPECIES: murein hydrolase activator EnvC family protein [Pseudooceanicola]|nr:MULTISPECIES: peptidoglycan DD-metalloendopeptidase family protein [Pseudooceanicola]
MLALALPPGLAAAEQSPSAMARSAAAELDAARGQLRDATGSRDRIAALTRTITAYETGLSALRESLRAAQLAEDKVRADLDARRDEIAALLGALAAMSRDPAPVHLLHPDGPVGTARAGMLLADATPALQSRAHELAGQLEALKTLKQTRQQAADQLIAAMQELQQARTTLSKAASDRTDLPSRFTADPMKTQLLQATAENLREVAANLDALPEGPVRAPATPGIGARKGHLALPVAGTLLRGANEADAAGIRRPGILIATRPRALVTTPVAATIRYAGPLLDYGNVIILEPQSGLLFVIAGLGAIFGNIGDVLPEGAPIGLMGGEELAARTQVTQAEEGTGSPRPETLYLEVRQDNDPVDPMNWFEVTKDKE